MNGDNHVQEFHQIINDTQLHHLMHKVVDIILCYTTQDPKDFSRPYLRFIESAYIELTAYYSEPRICFINGQPEGIETPWGEWQCFDTDRSGDGFLTYECKKYSNKHDWDRVLPELTKRLGLEPYQSWENTQDGHKLVYDQNSMTKVDDASLSDYCGYHDAYHKFGNDIELFGSMESAWKSLEARYATDSSNALYPGFDLSINDPALHDAAHRVVDIILSYATQDETVMDKPILMDNRIDQPRDTFFHTGLKLYFRNGQPRCLYTPWGVWACFRKSERKSDRHLWDEVFPELRKRLGLFATCAGDGCDFMEYALYEIDGALLPKHDVDSEIGDECADYLVDKMQYAWNKLERRRNEHNK